MNQIRLLLIAIVAVALGGFLGSVVYHNLQSKSDSAQPRVDVLVAANDLRVGSTIKDGDIKIVRFPADDLPANCYHLKSSVVGRSVILPIAKGEFFLPNKLAGENAGYGLSALIPPGMQAVSVLGVTDSVVPRTRVDVLLTRNRTGGGGAQTTTVLENVAVISSGQRLEGMQPDKPETAPVITLLVCPDDAQKLTLASQKRRIRLLLHNPLNKVPKNYNAPEQYDVPIVRWWSKAVNFISLFSLAAFRTPASPWDTRPPLCITNLQNVLRLQRFFSWRLC